MTTECAERHGKEAAFIQSEDRQVAELAQDARDVREELRRLAPMLAEDGLFVISKRTKKARLIVLTTRPERHLAEATIETNIPGR